MMVTRSRSTARPAGSGSLITLLAILVALAAATPLSYLLIRAADLGWTRVWDIALSARVGGLLLETSLLAVAVTATSVAVAVPLAWLTVRSDLPGRRLWVVISALPLAIPTYVGAFVLIAAFGPKGILQGWLEPVGVDRLPEIYGFRGAWFALSLFSYPYVLLPVRAALRRIDPGMEEASRLLGASSWQTFRRIVLPQLRPAISAGSLLVALYALSDFGAVSLMRFDSLTRAIFIQYRSSLDRSTAAVYGLVLVALTIVILTMEQRTRRREHYHRLHGGGGRAAATVRLGRLRWPAFLACGLLSLLALGVPLGVIGTWLVRGLRADEPIRLTWELARNSLTAAFLAAIVAVVVAWPVAIVVARRRGWLGRTVETLAWSGHALPGVVVALSLVFLGARVLPSLYQTLAMLVFAYVVLFLPQAVGSIRASLLQITPSIEEASLLLGRGPATTLRKIVLPLSRPGLAAAGALVFLTTMKELPATLLLAPTGYSTLATQVWSATSEAFFGRAAAPAAALILLSALPMTVLVLRESDS